MTQPLVRTNPVTGWKALYSGVLFAERIEGVTEIESRQLLEKIQRLITENHDLQIRVRWENPGDVGKPCPFSLVFLSVSSGRYLRAVLHDSLHHSLPLLTRFLHAVIWDNRSVLHAATQDHHGQGDRIGWRATSIGEKPYFDPASVSRKQALAAAK